MSADAFGITDTLDEHGGTIIEITGVSLENDTVAPETLARGVTAHDSEGTPITGIGDIGGYTYLEPIDLDVDVSTEEYDLDVEGTSESFDLDVDTKIENIIIEGHGLPPGGNIGDLIVKRTLDDYDVEWITPATHSEQDNTRPITAGAVYTEIGNINALLATI